MPLIVSSASRATINRFKKNKLKRKYNNNNKPQKKHFIRYWKGIKKTKCDWPVWSIQRNQPIVTANKRQRCARFIKCRPRNGHIWRLNDTSHNIDLYQHLAFLSVGSEGIYHFLKQQNGVVGEGGGAGLRLNRHIYSIIQLRYEID